MGKILTGRVGLTGDRHAIGQLIKIAKVKVDQTWTGAKDESYRNEVARVALGATQFTQVGTDAMDRSSFGRDTRLAMRSINYLRGAKEASFSNMLYSYFNWRMQTEPQARKEAYREFMTTMASTGFLQNLHYTLVKMAGYGAIGAGAAALFGSLGKDGDDEEEMAEKAQRLVNKAMGRTMFAMATAAPFSNFVVPLTVATAKKAMGKAVPPWEQERALAPYPWMAFLTDAAEIPVQGGAWIRHLKKAEDEKSSSARRRREIWADKAFIRMMNGVARSASNFTGIPIWFITNPVAREWRKKKERQER